MCEQYVKYTGALYDETKQQQENCKLLGSSHRCHTLFIDSTLSFQCIFLVILLVRWEETCEKKKAATQPFRIELWESDKSKAIDRSDKLRSKMCAHSINVRFNVVQRVFQFFPLPQQAPKRYVLEKLCSSQEKCSRHVRSSCQVICALNMQKQVENSYETKRKNITTYFSCSCVLRKFMP